MATPTGTGRTGTFTAEPAASDAMSAVLAQNWWLIALRGVFAILFGIIAFAAPGAVMLTLALFFAAYLLVDGVIGIAAAVRAARAHERWGLLLAEGALNIAPPLRRAARSREAPAQSRRQQQGAMMREQQALR